MAIPTPFIVAYYAKNVNDKNKYTRCKWCIENNRLARVERLELPTPGFGDLCSSQLSYTRIHKIVPRAAQLYKPQISILLDFLVKYYYVDNR